MYYQISQTTGKCHFIKPAFTSENGDGYIGLVDIVDHDTGEIVKDSWFNFAPNQIDEDIPINIQLTGKQRLAVIIEELEVSAKASKEDLIKYNKKVGDRETRISFL